MDVISYYSVAWSLKLFSVNDLTKRFYRWLGNLRNAVREETSIAGKYYFRTPAFLDMLRRHDVCTPGMNAFELGTGFVHWEAMMLRMEVNCTVTLYDVWDNRTFNRFQSYLCQLTDNDVRNRLQVGNAISDVALDGTASVANFEAAYRRLGFDYRLDPSGLLTGVKNDAYDLVVSSDVGEHLSLEDIPDIIERTYDILKPGGWVYHQIVLADHLKIYAHSVHPKQYLSYSKEHYARYLNNGVQYINQVQIPEWRALFEKAGFEIVEVDRVSTSDLSAIDIHPDWRDVAEDDLACTVVQFLLRKPNDADGS